MNTQIDDNKWWNNVLNQSENTMWWNNDFQKRWYKLMPQRDDTKRWHNFMKQTDEKCFTKINDIKWWQKTDDTQRVYKVMT